MVDDQVKKDLVDGMVVCAGHAGTDGFSLYTASEQDAQWLYAVAKPIAVERELKEMDEQGLHRTYYLELAQSDEHSLDDDGDEFDWNTRPVWQVTFEPTDLCTDRMMEWADEEGMSAPTDFTMSPVIAELIYRAGAHEVQGEDDPCIEFDATGLQKLQAEFQNIGIQTTNVGELWRMDGDASKQFREYAGIDHPTGVS